ncbi:MAG: FRG domain-containing protein [Sedimentisphaerales bacterium]|nr:FRG domain-containing protein [Sedimentisphaerales bacterium]
MTIKYTYIDGPRDLFEHFLALDKQRQTFRKVWIYRGQKSCEDDSGDFAKLKTSLEKALLRNEHPLKRAPGLERGLLRKFKRQSELFLEHVPDKGNYMEWFALMQEHGAPTRLQDWTYSFFVALYFALAELEKGDHGELWAVDSTYLVKRIEALYPKRSDHACVKDDPNAQVYTNFERMFMGREPKQFVCPMNPYKFNPRLIVQQGLFLCPGDITRPFAENIESHFALPRELDKHLKVFKIENKVRPELMQMLHSMNIGEASLFPGL